VRRWLTAVGLAMTLVLVGLSALTVVNRMARQTIQEEHIYGFKGKAVSIDLTVGEVAIVPGTVEDQILVRRQLTYGLRRPFVEERINGDTFEVRDGNCAMPVQTFCHVKWLLQVPPQLHLSVTTTTGAINVLPGMTGAVNLVSTSGAVTARGSAGPATQLLSHKGAVKGIGIRSSHVVATSESGNISLSFRNAPKFVQGKSKTGSVEVVLPDGNESYKIIARTDGGLRTIPGDQDENATRRITVESQKGNVTVEKASGTTGS